MQVIFHCWNVNNLHGAPGGPTAFGMSTARPTGLSSAAPGSHRPRDSPHVGHDKVVKDQTF